MPVPIFVVDAFTDQPFAGNPAGVCLLESPADERWMHSVAAEMKHAETAFLVRREDGYDLRWFTPTVEVDLCGHATLASAHVLWEQGLVADGDEARFTTKSGVLTARQDSGGIVLNFPSEPWNPAPAPPDLANALGVPIEAFGQNRFDYLVVLENETAVRRLQPNIAKLSGYPVRGVIVTSAADTEGVDFVSRFFAPQSGVDEDAVTGSAHCCLGPYWSERLGRDRLRGFQASARGGFVGVAMRGDRVELIGNAVTVIRGELTA